MLFQTICITLAIFRLLLESSLIIFLSLNTFACRFNNCTFQDKRAKLLRRELVGGQASSSDGCSLSAHMRQAIFYPAITDCHITFIPVSCVVDVTQSSLAHHLCSFSC